MKISRLDIIVLRFLILADMGTKPTTDSASLPNNQHRQKVSALFCGRKMIL
jgi:hypothetical protein